MKLQNFYLDSKLGPHVKEIMAVHIYIYYEYCLYIWSVSAIYPHMNSWVLDEWLYYELLRKTTEYTKEKSTYVYEALTYYYESMTMASPTLHFQAVFQKKTNSPTTGYFILFHSWIKNICYQVHWGNFLLTW